MILVTPHCTGIVLLRSVMCWKLLYNIHGLSFNSLLVDKFLLVLKNKEWGPASFSDKSVPCQLWMGGMVGITNDDLESEVLWTFMCSALIIFLLFYPCPRGMWGPSVGRLGWCAHCCCWSAGHWGCHWRFSGPLVRGLEVLPSCHHSEGNYFHVLPLGRMPGWSVVRCWAMAFFWSARWYWGRCQAASRNISFLFLLFTPSYPRGRYRGRVPVSASSPHTSAPLVPGEGGLDDLGPEARVVTPVNSIMISSANTDQGKSRLVLRSLRRASLVMVAHIALVSCILVVMSSMARKPSSWFEGQSTETLMKSQI